MEKRIKKMLLAILMIISVLAADFFVLGSGIMTYAAELNSKTNNENVEFLVFFKDGENKLDSVQKSIKDTDVKLYAEIKVNNEGYLKEGTVIELENSNFNLKNEILTSNKYINSIQGNKVNLKQINAGETAKIELGIEPVIADKITADFLSKTSTVKLIGSYVYSKEEEGQSIRTDKVVCINYQPDETTATEFETSIITNTVLPVNGTNKRIVQLLVKSRLTNNEYPVKQTTISADIPVINEETPEVSAMAISKLATNGTKEINNVIIEEGKVKITIDNNPDEKNQISWNKNIYDEVVITYAYPETVKASDIYHMESSVLMSVYNSEKTYVPLNYENLAIGEAVTESNNVIIGKNKITTNELYKGKLYAKLEANYNTETEVAITNPNAVEEIVIHEGPDAFGTSESELSANTKYISTEINLEEMLAVVGTDGNIEIKNGEKTILINKDTEVDANGNVVINYENGTSELYITTSNPVKEGILELRHTKAIVANNYTRTELQSVKTLIAKGSLEGNITVDKEKQSVISASTESGTLELKETTTKAELTIENNKTELSTIQENQVTLGITLVTNGEQYDLHKNPKISLKFPEAVKNVELISDPIKRNADEFTVNIGTYDETKKTMQIVMQGEQLAYPDSTLTQSYIQLNLKVVLDSLALAKTDNIMMAYTNENAVQYENGRTDAGIVEQSIQISAPSQLIKMFDLSINENKSTTETILQQINENHAGKTVEFGISLINNNDSDISNLKILGKLPTTGNVIAETENTLETTLTGIIAENSSIYYTENSSATVDIEDTTNGWTQDLSSISDAKLYLIKVDSLGRGETYTATVNVQIPNNIVANALSYTQYGVIYNTASKTDVKESSRKIGLASSLAATITTQITAQVGQDILEDGDIVKEGEVIKYTVTVKNSGKEKLQNIQLNLDVPEGTVYVKGVGTKTSYDGITPEEGSEYVKLYFKEITDSQELEELTKITIPELAVNQTYTKQYEVRVNKGSANTEISNNTTVIYGETLLRCKEFKNIIEESNIRVTIKRTLDDSITIYPGTESRYAIFVENLSTSTIKDLELEIIPKGFMILDEIDNKQLSGKFKIDEIAPKDENNDGMVCIGIYGIVASNVDEMSIFANVKDMDGKKYRSNMLTTELSRLGATISMTSPQNGKFIQEGDLVEYNITLKNTGDIVSVLNIVNKMPTFLSAQSIYVNNELKVQKVNSNNINYAITLQPQEQVQVNIIAKVGYIEEVYNGKTIKNMATVSGVNVKENSSIITHILKAKTKQNEETENVISGFAWLDSNENGRRDSYEKTLSGVKVKLYNTLDNHYVSTKNGNVMEIITDENGEYYFSEIEDGSYLVVFEYDTEKYEFTTSFAKDVDTSLNSKATLKQIITDETKIRVAAIEINNLNSNVLDMNIGLKKNTGETPKEEQPGVIEGSGESDNPQNPNNPENPNNPDTTQRQKTISGAAWLDENENGQKDGVEEYLLGVKVRLYNVSTENYITDENGKIVEIITDENGRYEFTNLEKGEYVVIFEYDTEEYKLATQNSKIVAKKIEINGQEVLVGLTETINLEDNITNINIGLIENLKFDLELEKYISKIVVQTNKETKTYNYDEKVLGKVEIHRKQVEGALVVLEYTIKVKNTGEIVGTASNIVDYLPSGLTFSSELNRDWYVSGNNLYTKSLENVQINPGQEKEVKLILTKVMTNNNLGLINNRAEIYEDYNKYGDNDIDSTPNNQIQTEDDFGTTDVIIQVATGGGTTIYIMLLMINVVLIYVAIKIMMKNEIIKIKNRKERR